MILDDRQKVICSALFLQKQMIVPLDILTRVQMQQEYIKALNIEDHIFICQEIQKEEGNFIMCITSYLDGTFKFNHEASDLSNDEKSIIHQTELCLIEGDMPIDIKVELQHKIREALGITVKQHEELAEAIMNQLNTLLDYIDYYRKNHE